MGFGHLENDTLRGIILMKYTTTKNLAAIINWLHMTLFNFSIKNKIQDFQYLNELSPHLSIDSINFYNERILNVKIS